MGRGPVLARLVNRLVPCRIRPRGRHYLRTAAHLAETGRLGGDELARYQIARLRSLTEYCMARVPFYKESFRRCGFDPAKLATLDDLRRIPVLTKSDLRENLPLLRATGIPERSLSYGTTGGTTGEPVGFYELAGRLSQIEEAFVHDAWSALGYDRCDMLAVLRGSTVPGAGDGFHWIRYPHMRRLFLSTFHLDERSAVRYAELMQRFSARFLHVFPSSAGLLCDLLEDAGIRPGPLRGVFSSSEVLTAAVRRKVEAAFGCRMLDLYGSSERVLLGVECTASGCFHFYPQYGFLELLDESGDPVREPGGRGEIVGTSFGRMATPLLRYGIGDAGVLAEPGCPCGRCWPTLSSIEGRIEESVVASDGRKISMSLMNFHSDTFDCISRFQFAQSIPGRVEFRYVPRAAVTPRAVETMAAEIRGKLGAGFELTMREVGGIERARSGKHRLLDHTPPETPSPD